MICPACGSTDTRVFKTRHRKLSTFRTRKCKSAICGHTFTTEEHPDPRARALHIARLRNTGLDWHSIGAATGLSAARACSIHSDHEEQAR